MGGFFFIPSEPDEFIMGGTKAFEKWKFASDTTAQIYRINTTHVERGQLISNNVLWRQDSLIKKAMALFALDKKTEALAAFKIAYAKSSQHFYLAEYIKHLAFILKPD
ncbi:MAG: hypothetical protein ACI8P3_002182 [Saprospiraceae bacterium]|jgi:hypothetical protein